MKKKFMKLASLALSASLVIGSALGLSVPTKVKAADTPTIWIVGDSTVCSFEGVDDSLYYPRYGWGTQIANYTDGTYEIKNLALSGRSSKSFTSESNYTELVNEMKPGDLLLIGFGHNDEKAEEARYTNPNGDYTTEGSFANSLYENYVKKAQDAGATPILVTPLVRRVESGEVSGSTAHITSDVPGFPGGDYPQAIRDLGSSLNVPVADLTANTLELYNSIGPDETINLHSWTSSNKKSVDNTHTNIYGAARNAHFIAQAIKDANIEGVSEHFPDSDAPGIETLIANPDYVEKDYTAPADDASSVLGDTAGIWHPTAFGNIGGTPSSDKEVFEYDPETDTYHMAMVGKGKIAAASDGIMMYYTKVPAGKTFTLTADMTVNSFDKNDQVSFGLMARDDMYIDLNDSSIASDYVAAAPLKLASGSVYNNFKRQGSKLTSGGEMTEGVVAGQTYSLKIASNSDGYECTFGNEAPVSGGFDFQLTSIDPDYVYVGMFVARKADVTFSNVSLVINDDPEATSDDTSNDTSDDTSADTSSETSDDASAEPVLEADASVEETSSEKLAEAAPAAETKAENLVRTSAVKTGDLSNLLIYALASTLALSGLIIASRKKNI